MPIGAVQAINKTVIVTKPSWFNKLEAKAFVEAVSASITGKWINKVMVQQNFSFCQL